MSKHVLLTGVTGFVGKVVLAELLRRRVELGVDCITLLIRAKAARNGGIISPQERFAQQVACSPALADLESDWLQRVNVVAADLEHEHCGIVHLERLALQARITHVIHCAASVDFDLPIRQAADANIVSALNVLELARACSLLVGMVDVSTAYVAAWRAGPIHETLAHLPRPAAELFDALKNNTRSEQTLLQESGHPNTYTYTKCLAEHLLSERRGNVPLAIVRPSIISVAWQRPFPGWIDSAAAFAGCLLYSGLGVVRAWNADPTNRLDVVPVDVVVDRILDAAFVARFPTPNEQVPIHFAAMGIQNAMRIDMSALSTAQYFRERLGHKVPPLFIGRTEHGFRYMDFKRRALPMQAMRIFYALTMRHKARRRIEKANQKIRYLNAAFGYFTHHSFDFRPRVPMHAPKFSPRKYMDVVNRGIFRHLLKRDSTQTLLAGKEHSDARSDLLWTLDKPEGTAAIRVLGYLFRKALRRSTSRVTFDRDSFEHAVQSSPPNTLFVLAPSHRSYFDFLLTSYLCFQHPELGIPVPHIAAAEEFSRIPVAGRLLKQAQAFFIQRGVGKAVPELTAELQRITTRAAALMFFTEGQRSRSRRMLAPKRGLLRGLQATRRTFAVLPIAISYEHVPEQTAFDRELAGGARSKMSLRAISSWTMRLLKRQVSLGHVHLACAAPLMLDTATDVPQLADELTEQLQRQTVVTRFHLRAFMAQTKLSGIDESWLAYAIEQRGGRVLESNTALPDTLSPILQQNLQNQWIHWFYPDALALFPDDPDVRDHVARHSWSHLPVTANSIDARVEQVVRSLFAPMQRDYALVRTLAKPMNATVNARDIIKAHPGAYLPHIEDALLALETESARAPHLPRMVASSRSIETAS